MLVSWRRPPSMSGVWPPVSSLHRGVLSHAGSSIFQEPDVLELLVGVVIGRRHVVLHLAPVHDPARPPETRQVVGVGEDTLLEPDDGRLALGRVDGPRLP